MNMKTFSERVVELACSIPLGRVTTYGRIARAAGGSPMASQSITSILSKAENEGARKIPYHRIVYANGRVWMNNIHRAERVKLYEKEGIELNKKDIIANFSEVLYEFD